MHIAPEVAERIENARCCVICGKHEPLNRHHIVPKSAGELYENGKKLRKCLITLCGNGSWLGSSGSAEFCHGKAHHRMIHFRNDRGRLEFIELDEPTKYQEALAMDGWEPIEVMA